MTLTRLLRLRRGLRQDELALAADIGVGSLSRLENGRPVLWTTTQRVAYALRVPVAELFASAPRCWFCDKPAEHEHHHPLPRAEGGTATVPACGRCNCSLQDNDATDDRCLRCDALVRVGEDEQGRMVTCTPSVCGRCEVRSTLGLANPGWTLSGQRWHHGHTAADMRPR